MRVCKSQTKTSSLPRCCQPALGKLHGSKINMYGKYCRPGHKKNLNIGNMFGFYDVDGRLDIALAGTAPAWVYRPFSWSFAKLRGWKVAKSKLDQIGTWDQLCKQSIKTVTRQPTLLVFDLAGYEWLGTFFHDFPRQFMAIGMAAYKGNQKEWTGNEENSR